MQDPLVSLAFVREVAHDPILSLHTGMPWRIPTRARHELHSAVDFCLCTGRSAALLRLPHFCDATDLAASVDWTAMAEIAATTWQADVLAMAASMGVRMSPQMLVSATSTAPPGWNGANNILRRLRVEQGDVRAGGRTVSFLVEKGVDRNAWTIVAAEQMRRDGFEDLSNAIFAGSSKT